MRNVYGATETSGLAADCGHHHGLHLFEDLVITGIVDENNQPVPAGTYGAKVLATVLFSRTVPLIRYEMTDSVQPAAAHPCPCGRPYATISGIQGRQQDTLRFAALDAPGTPAVEPIVFHHLMDRIDAAGWQIIQRPDVLEVLIARPPHLDIDAAAELRATLAHQRVSPPTIHIRPVETIPRSPLGKAHSSSPNLRPITLARTNPPPSGETDPVPGTAAPPAPPASTSCPPQSAPSSRCSVRVAVFGAEAVLAVGRRRWKSAIGIPRAGRTLDTQRR